MESLVGAFTFAIAIIIIFVLAVMALYLWAVVSSKWKKNKVEIYKRKVKKAEKMKRAQLTKEEKETIAREVDDIDVISGPRIDISSVDWRFEVDDEDVTYRKKKDKK